MSKTPEIQEVSLASVVKTEEDKSGEVESSFFTCEICIEPTLSPKKFKNNDECSHPYCGDCLAKYIYVKIGDNVANIKCPASGCNQFLDPLTCQTIISEELFDKWCDVLCDSSLLGLDRCYCPNTNCSVLVINECGRNVKKSTCPNCKKLFCFRCQVPWHAGYWCTESQQRRDTNDVKFGILIEKFKWTRCGKCGQAIERISGCQLVKCRCGNQICHRCGESPHIGSCDQPRDFGDGDGFTMFCWFLVISSVAFFVTVLRLYWFRT